MSVFTGPIFMLDETLYSPELAYSTDSLSGFTLSNVADRIHPFRVYKSSVDPNSSDISIVYDLGAAAPKVSGVFIDNTNLGTWKIQHCATVGGTYTDWLASTTSQLDLLTERGKVYLDTSSLGANLRYLKLLAPSQTPLAAPLTTGVVGGITIGLEDTVMELPGGGTTNIEFTTNLPTIVTNFAGGSLEPTEIGSKFVEIVLPNDQYLRESQEDTLMQILNMGTAPFVFFENAGDISRAYLVRHTQNKNKIAVTVGQVLNVPMSFTEVL